MTMAVTDALARGAAGGDLRLHRQHLGLGRRLRGPGGHDLRGARAAGQDRAGQARPGRHARRPDPAGRGQLRRLPGAGPQDHRATTRHRRWSTRSTRSASRARRPRRSRSATRSATRPTCTACRRQRRQHHRVLARLLASTTPTASPRRARGCSVSRPPVRPRWCTARRSRTRRPSPPRSGSARPRRGTVRSTAADESGGAFRAVTDEEILEAYRLLAAHRGRLRRAGVGGERGRPAGRAQGGLARLRPDRGVHGHRQRPQGSRHRAGGNACGAAHPGRPRGCGRALELV